MLFVNPNVLKSVPTGKLYGNWVLTPVEGFTKLTVGLTTDDCVEDDEVNEEEVGWIMAGVVRFKDGAVGRLNPRLELPVENKYEGVDIWDVVSEDKEGLLVDVVVVVFEITVTGEPVNEEEGIVTAVGLVIW